MSPTHIAFEGNDRPTVRNCYAAALNAGGRPSGAPSYRNNDCSCFNAAVEDLDGNTIEFIFKEPCECKEDDLPALPEQSRVLTWQGDVSRSGANDDVQSLASKVSRSKSRAQTALDLASTTSKSMKKSEAPTPGISRSQTAPVASTSDNGGKSIVGTLLGVAAGAAVAYAMCQSEKDNARDEAAYAHSMRSKASSPKDHRSRSNYEKSMVSKSSRRDYSTVESARSSRHPPRSMRLIEPAPYDDNEIQDVISRYTSSRRPGPQRSQTYNVIEYTPMSATSGRSNRSRMKRASTMPIELPDYLLEGTRTEPASRHTSRRGSLKDSKLKRHDSVISTRSHHSRRSVDGRRRSSTSKASTARPLRQGSLYDSAANVPLPSSKAQSYFNNADRSVPASKAASYKSASQVPVPRSYTNGGYTNPGEESDGLSDMRTVVPDDSISCIDFKPKKSKSSSKSARHSSQRSEAPSERTVRPAIPSTSRHSAQTLPVRSKDDHYSNKGGKRSMLSYA